MKYITLAGEPSLDTSWAETLKNKKDVDELILITKNPGAFVMSELEYVLEQHKNKITLYCCITGYGKSAVEPGVGPYQSALVSMQYLINKGYNIVLYINPIFPTINGFQLVMDIIEYCKKINILNGLTIAFNFIERIDNEVDRNLEYPWITEDCNTLPNEDNIELGYVSINTIIDYFISIENEENCIIKTNNKSIKVSKWYDDFTANAAEILYGDDIYKQCKYGCRYCYHSDYEPIEE